MTEDERHLDLLAVFHYVMAALVGLCSLIPVIHLVVGIGLASGRLDADDPTAQTVGGFLVIVAIVIIVLGLGFAALVLAAGRFLARRRHYTFCLVVAGLLCLMMPLGTVLGVFSIIVLMRESVRRLFGVETAPATPATSA